MESYYENFLSTFSSFDKLEVQFLIQNINIFPQI